MGESADYPLLTPAALKKATGTALILYEDFFGFMDADIYERGYGSEIQGLYKLFRLFKELMDYHHPDMGKFDFDITQDGGLTLKVLERGPQMHMLEEMLSLTRLQ